MQDGRLAKIADVADMRGGCAEGVAFGREYAGSDVASAMDPQHAAWVLVHCPDIISEDERREFLAASGRGCWGALDAVLGAELSATERKAMLVIVARDLEEELGKLSRSMAVSLKREHKGKLPPRVLAAIDRVLARRDGRLEAGIVDSS